MLCFDLTRSLSTEANHLSFSNLSNYLFIMIQISGRRTCGLVVKALASCLVGRWDFKNFLKNWNLLQSGQALGIMTVAGKFSNADASFVGVRSCCHRRPSVCGWEMGVLFNTLNKSLPGRSSMPLEGRFLCCALSVLAIALYKNFPQNVLVSSSFWSPRNVCMYLLETTSLRHN